jgi:two-component system, LuxR family, response regulator FixJ
VTTNQKAQEAIVYVVDDDQGVRDSLQLLLRSVGLHCETFASAPAFLKAYERGRVDCLVADIRMPGMSGLDLQQALIDEKFDIPIIFITGHGDVPMAVNAMKLGAMDFLQKPFRDQELLDRVNTALQRARDSFEDHLKTDEIRARLSTLTPREAEVMEMVVLGSANKVIAMDLGVSQRTVELHRARVMRKMQVRSLAELVRLVERTRAAE